MKKISEQLKKMRLENNLTQAEMAKRIGISFPIYNKLENGSKTLSLKTAEKLSKFTGFSYGYIREHL